MRDVPQLCLCLCFACACALPLLRVCFAAYMSARITHSPLQLHAKREAGQCEPYAYLRDYLDIMKYDGACAPLEHVFTIDLAIKISRLKYTSISGLYKMSVWRSQIS